MAGAGTFTISLDFELLWGVRDKRAISAYGANILGVREVVPCLLDRFSSSGVRCTWATVGLLFFDRKEEPIEFMPDIRPQYVDAALSHYPAIEHIGDSEREDPYHYGLSLIRRIMSHDGQEIGTHTFCHYYCLEAGQTAEAFRADLAAARAAAKRLNIELKSLVFPRNQFNADSLEICREAGLIAFRGNEEAWSHAAVGGREGRVRRAFRLLDGYLELSGHQCYSPEADPTGLWNIRSSRFLRPVSRHLGALEETRLRRIESSMSHAARTGTVFHLWWHPHNFGADLEANVRFLDRVLAYYRDLRERYGMRSFTMAELAETAASGTDHGAHRPSRG